MLSIRPQPTRRKSPAGAVGPAQRHSALRPLSAQIHIKFYTTKAGTPLYTNKPPKSKAPQPPRQDFRPPPPPPPPDATATQRNQQTQHKAKAPTPPSRRRRPVPPPPDFEKIRLGPVAIAGRVASGPEAFLRKAWNFVSTYRYAVGTLAGVAGLLTLFGLKGIAKGALYSVLGVAGLGAVAWLGYRGLYAWIGLKIRPMLRLVISLMRTRRQEVESLIGPMRSVKVSNILTKVTNEDTPAGERKILVVVVPISGAYGDGVLQFKAVPPGYSTVGQDPAIERADASTTKRPGFERFLRTISPFYHHIVTKAWLDLVDHRNGEMKRMKLVDQVEYFKIYDLKSQRLYNPIIDHKDIPEEAYASSCGNEENDDR